MVEAAGVEPVPVAKSFPCSPLESPPVLETFWRRAASSHWRCDGPSLLSHTALLGARTLSLDRGRHVDPQLLVVAAAQGVCKGWSGWKTRFAFEVALRGC